MKEKTGGLFDRRGRFFEDYIVREELNDRGRRVEMVYYNAEYYRTEWDEPAIKRNKLLCLLFSAAVCACGVIPLATYHDTMFKMAVVLGFVLTLVSSVFMLIAAAKLPFSAEPLERADKYYGFERLKLWSVIGTAGSAFAAVMNAVYLLFVLKELQHPGLDIAVTVCGLLGAAAAFSVYRIMACAGLHETDEKPAWQLKEDPYGENGPEEISAEDTAAGSEEK